MNIVIKLFGQHFFFFFFYILNFTVWLLSSELQIIEKIAVQTA